MEVDSSVYIDHQIHGIESRKRKEEEDDGQMHQSVRTKSHSEENEKQEDQRIQREKREENKGTVLFKYQRLLYEGAKRENTTHQRKYSQQISDHQEVFQWDGQNVIEYVKNQKELPFD